jgi:hypothetical protein
MPATDIFGKVGEKLGAEFKTLSTQLTDDYATKVSLGNVQTDLTALTARVTTEEGNVDTLQSDLTALTSRVTTEEGNVDTLQSDLTALTSRVTTEEGNVDTLQSDMSQAQTDISSNATSISNLVDGTDSFTSLKATSAEIGDLTVTGTTTTLNTTTVSVEDNIIEVNLQSDGSATATTGGLEVNRGSGVDKASFVFDEAVDKFKVLIGTSSANLVAGTVEANLTGDVTGNVTGNVTGDVTGSLAAPSSTGITINSVALGDYSTFETAFNTAKA